MVFHLIYPDTLFRSSAHDAVPICSQALGVQFNDTSVMLYIHLACHWAN